jgi:hypothetical protein
MFSFCQKSWEVVRNIRFPSVNTTWQSILVFEISARNVPFLPEFWKLINFLIYHHYVENLQFCTVLLEMIISARILPEFRKLINFLIYHHYVENLQFCTVLLEMIISARILKTDQFPYISPLCWKSTVLITTGFFGNYEWNHFGIFTFTYVLYRRLGQIFQFWNSGHFWDYPDCKIPPEIILESSVLHRFYIGDSIWFFSSEIPDFFEIFQIAMKSFWNLQFYIGFI